MGALKSYTACAEDAGSRIDAVLAAHGLYPSRSAAARAVDDGAVYVNGSTVAKKHTLCAGDTVVYEVPDAPEQGPVQGQAIPLDIRYEDDDMLVISKQAGLVCHPSIDHSDGTLVNALVYHCGVEHLCNVQGESDRPGIVHRLDRDTTGLMLAAKNDAAGLALMADIRDRAVDRRYLALVHGVIPHDTGMIDAPIARSLNERTRMAVRECPSARDALTTFRVLERFEHGPRDNGYTLIDCKGADANFGLDRQFLHSFQVGFTQPMTGEDLFFADNLTDDLAAVLDQLASRSLGRTEAGREVFELLADSPHPTAPVHHLEDFGAL